MASTNSANVSSIMTPEVVKVRMDDSLNTVKEIFSSSHFHHLLVIENRKLVGIISDRDLLKALSPHTSAHSLKNLVMPLR